MNYPNTQNGRNDNGSYILDGVSEKIITLSNLLINDWINRIMSERPTTTIDELRTMFNKLVNDNTTQIPEYLRYLSWGDSFMIDQTMFHEGGSRRFIDYPGLTSPKYGDIITINGEKHRIYNIGLLTFDSSVIPTCNCLGKKTNAVATSSESSDGLAQSCSVCNDSDSDDDY